MAAKFDMKVDQGSTFEMVLKITDESGTLVDLTGHVFTGHVRTSISAPSTLFVLSFSIPVQTGDDLGKVVVSIPAAVSSAVPVPTQNGTTRSELAFAYDIESFFGGKTKRWLEGKILLSPEVTRV